MEFVSEEANTGVSRMDAEPIISITLKAPPHQVFRHVNVNINVKNAMLMDRSVWIKL